MDLQRVREHDQDDDGEPSYRRRRGGGIHGDNVSRNVVAVGKISCDPRKDIQNASGANSAENNRGGTEVAIVSDFIENRKHVLVTCVCKDYNGKAGKDSDWTCPSEDADFAAVLKGVAFDEVGYHQDDEVGDRAEGNYRGVL